ncbi:hypothetical protein HT136_06935 [Novosphingobium profundi]|uniref:hypothetical protein n=1 Tax=Novosphingobium profundi TaxID=1774954 RepID=UPI001BDA9058|nr:hypothetical protein [Novosphingobium profundi]MBT0668100.1 hypothetical protein [Novosphingobium profundi]
MDAIDYDPDYDGRTVFLPDVSLFRPGDIVLTSSVESTDERSRGISQRICEATGSRFSHALICTSPPTLTEAISEGVSSLSLVNCFAHALENVRILRHRNEGLARRAAAYAQQGIGREYSFRQAMQSLRSDDSAVAKISDNGTFCSAFVAQAFLKAGADEFSGVPIEKTTPAILESLDGLVDVTNQVFHAEMAPRNIEQMSALDGDYALTPSSPQTEIFQRYAKAVLPIAERVLKDFPEAELERQTTYFGLLLMILSADAAIQKIDDSRRAQFSCAIAELDTALAAQQADGALKALHAKMVASDTEQLLRNLQETFAATPDIDVAAMKSLYKTGEEGIAQRKFALNSMKIGQVWQSIKAHCEVQEAGIYFLIQRQKLIEEVLNRMGCSPSG